MLQDLPLAQAEGAAPPLSPPHPLSDPFEMQTPLLFLVAFLPVQPVDSLLATAHPRESTAEADRRGDFPSPGPAVLSASAITQLPLGSSTTPKHLWFISSLSASCSPIFAQALDLFVTFTELNQLADAPAIWPKEESDNK